jgi:cytochrome c oxidase subunit 2
MSGWGRGSPRRRGRSFELVTVGAVGLLLAGCGTDFGAPHAATEQGTETASLWRIFLVGALAVAALIWILVLWSVLRYRRRRGDDGEVPPQRQYNNKMEVLYTVVPIVAVAFLFAITVVATEKVTSTSARPDLTIDVHGFQWQWRFDYKGQGITINGVQGSPPELVLPVGETIQFDLISDDVIHSFWVPEFLEKRDLIPGQKNEVQVKITAPGEWAGRCAEFCGLDHWLMTFTVRAVPRDVFQAWVEQASAQPQPILSTTR